jgi:hypothetical protein
LATAAVGGFLEEIQDLLPLDDLDRVFLLLEQLAHGRLVGAIRLVLEAVDLDRRFGHALLPLERLGRLHHLLRAGHDDAGELTRPRPDDLDLIQPHDVGGGIDRIHDVIERARQREDVLAIERRDERAVQALDDLSGQDVTVVLDLVDGVGAVPERMIGGQHLDENGSAAADLFRQRDEIVVEPFFSRYQSECHATPGGES